MHTLLLIVVFIVLVVGLWALVRLAERRYDQERKPK